MSKKAINKYGDVLDGVQAQMSRELAGSEQDGMAGMYARGFSTEGYAGGYQQGLRDAMAYLQGYVNNNSRYAHLWEAKPVRKKRNLNGT